MRNGRGTNPFFQLQAFEKMDGRIVSSVLLASDDGLTLQKNRFDKDEANGSISFYHQIDAAVGVNATENRKNSEFQPAAHFFSVTHKIID